MKRAMISLALGAVVAGFSLWSAMWVLPLPQRLAEADSTVVEWRNGEPAHVFLAPDGRWRLQTQLKKVDPHYIEALIGYEDKRFYTHGGIDLRAIVRATTSNIRHGRVVSGASTLTMQLVRMVEPRPRTLRSKIIEAFRAAQLEQHLSKDEILAAYLKFLPFGRNVEGLETAAWMYFGHDATALSPAEIATLLAVPQSPNQRYPTPKNAARLRSARADIAAELLEAARLLRGAAPENLSDAQALAQIEAQPLPTRLRSMPREMPHFAIWLRQQYPGVPRLRSTIDASTQRTVEKLATSHRGRIMRLGANNAAVVVIDHESGALRAALGNFDFDDLINQGQIPGFAVRRSSGSLLKPIILAQAIDAGIALPSHLVADVPVDYSGYQPQNYSEEFNGLVRLDDALSRSLNIPFVRLVERLGVAPFLEMLRRLGAEDIDPRPGYYGLSVAIGGISATPLEIAGMYTALARRGERAPLYFLKADEDADYGNAFAYRRGSFSPGAARLVAEVMSQRGRPDSLALRRIRATPNRYAWKTGTSMGLRDAWTAGFGAQHTAAIWTGNFDNRGQTGVVGSQAAAPLFFDIMEAVDSGLNFAAMTPESASTTAIDELSEVEVCAYSGHLPTSACTHKKTVQIPTDSTPTAPCPFHTLRDIDEATGLALNLECRQSRPHQTRSYVVWPTSVRRTMKDAGYKLPAKPPGFAPGCGPSGYDTRPSIVSPAPDTVFALLSDISPAEQMLPLIAETHEAGARFSWFVNGEYLGSAPSGEALWWEPKRGAHEIVVSDARGGSARVRVLIE